jgi:hypothetical protein
MTIEQSPQQQTESILRSLEEKGIPAAPVAEATTLAISHPEAVSALAIAVMRRFPKGGTFLDAALSYLPEKDWPALVQHALVSLDESAEKSFSAVGSIVAYASLQSPKALHPHLSHIFLVRPNEGCYYERFPWRESGDLHFDYLRSVIESTSSTDDARTRAWTNMCETRHARVMQYALSCADLPGLSPSGWGPQKEWVMASLHLIGFHHDGHSLQRTCRDALFHFRFSDAYFDLKSRPPWLARIHPTWKLSAKTQVVPFGGISSSRCSLCNEKLHRLFFLDPVPAELGITRLRRVELATCLSCLGWERQPLFYRHDQDGCPSNVAYKGPAVKPQFPVGPLKETEAWLAETPRRWYWQDWALSNSRENLNRIGGEPCWIQNAEYPHCPSCQKLMPYLMQLDSDLPTADGHEWLWGSGGICYGFWCDDCKLSGFLWQCT